MHARANFYILILAFSFIQIAGCAFYQTKVKENEKEAGTVLRSTDGLSQITLPDGWLKHRKLNDDAELQAANLTKQLYVIVLAEKKKDLKNIALEDYSAITLDRLFQSLTTPKVKGPKKLTINGRPAVQYDVEGLFENTKISYLNTVIETRKNFYQILAWTSKSGFENNRSELQHLIHSFKS